MLGEFSGGDFLTHQIAVLLPFLSFIICHPLDYTYPLCTVITTFKTLASAPFEIIFLSLPENTFYWKIVKYAKDWEGK